MWCQIAWVCSQSLGRVRLLATPQTVTLQAPLSMGFSRQEYWSSLPFPPPGDRLHPGSQVEGDAKSRTIELKIFNYFTMEWSDSVRSEFLPALFKHLRLFPTLFPPSAIRQWKYSQRKLIVKEAFKKYLENRNCNLSFLLWFPPRQ